MVGVVTLFNVVFWYSSNTSNEHALACHTHLENKTKLSVKQVIQAYLAKWSIHHWYLVIWCLHLPFTYSAIRQLELPLCGVN
jgi:hypothetical protein